MCVVVDLSTRRRSVIADSSSFFVDDEYFFTMLFSYSIFACRPQVVKFRKLKFFNFFAAIEPNNKLDPLLSTKISLSRHFAVFSRFKPKKDFSMENPIEIFPLKNRRFRRRVVDRANSSSMLKFRRDAHVYKSIKKYEKSSLKMFISYKIKMFKYQTFY